MLIDARIADLERQVNFSKSKLETGAHAEHLIGQMMEAGFIEQ